MCHTIKNEIVKKKIFFALQGGGAQMGLEKLRTK